MSNFIEPIGKLINAFTKLPGVGTKSAQRFAYKIIDMPEEDAIAFAESIINCKKSIRYCRVCGNYTDREVCGICSTRKPDVICVVKEPKDILALEKVHEFSGVYHVLHGTLRPSDNVGPKDLNIDGLIDRIKQGGVKEVIMATNPDYDGEITAMYVSSVIKPLGVKVTRLAHGIPIGSDIEYTDEVTLSRALTDRKEL
ncbi:MAG: recombination protein RecR [Clostridia bacterium]|jgi:recombination protein RecR|nr:recombination protein RecR [Clostridia bacterium]